MTIDCAKLPAPWRHIVVNGDPSARKTTLAKKLPGALGAKSISFNDD
ncbi:MAG: hypothetical protein ABSG59_16205 [Verrucomicrobiota bacterium]|jgi:broad-specificity NMP kinase